jgi:glucose/arabinose dehydrogenase
MVERPRGLRPSSPTNWRYVFLITTALVLGGVLLGLNGRHGPATVVAAEFDVSVVASGLSVPWDMERAPDGIIWFSERGGRISRLDLATNRVTIAGTVSGVLQNGESGLLGIALHPDFPREPFVYAMHTYSGSGGPRNRLVRLKWNGKELGEQLALFENIPGAMFHNGSRIAVGPDRLLYISTGESFNAPLAQDSTSLGGKILRLTLDGKPAPGNPFGSAIWAWGNRNPQGLVFHPTTGVLYETEHGAGDNDEVNIIEPGRNYGWPDVHGACDQPQEVTFCRMHNVAVPLTTWTPTVAISGVDLYLSDRVPSLTNSLVATSLGGRTLWRIKLSADGKSVTETAPILAATYGRLRDVLVLPDGSMLIATSNRDGRGSPSDADDRILKLTPRR